MRNHGNVISDTGRDAAEGKGDDYEEAGPRDFESFSANNRSGCAKGGLGSFRAGPEARNDTDTDDERLAIYAKIDDIYAGNDIEVIIRDKDVPPGAPKGLTATPGNGKVTLSWTLPTQAVDSWELKQDSADWATVSPTGWNPRIHSVTGLTNGTAYTFQVRGKNSAGDGTAATVTATPSAATTAPGAVTGLTAVGRNGGVLLSWTPPSGPITGYEYRDQWAPRTGWPNRWNPTGSLAPRYRRGRLANVP